MVGEVADESLKLNSGTSLIRNWYFTVIGIASREE